MFSSCGYDPDNRNDVRSGPKPPEMSMDEYMRHVKRHSEAWYESSMHRNVLDMITTRIFVMIEDDYLPVDESVMRLIDLLIRAPRCAVASACQTYRCPALGEMGIAPSEKIVWDGKKIVEKVCFDPGVRGVRRAQGTSFSCFAAKAAPYREAFDCARRRGLLMTYIGHDQVIMNVITQLGWRVLVDFDLWGEHMQLTPDGIYNYGKKDAVKDSYAWNEKAGSYDYKRVR